MKASEMTNEELAKALMSRVPLDRDRHDDLREASARLRKMDVLKMKVVELRECLKEAVTEVCNRLEKCGFKEPCVFKTCYVQKWRNALRKEGSEK